MQFRRTSALSGVFVFAVFLAGTAAAGALSGAVIHPDGSMIDDAPVRVRNMDSNIDVRTRSDAEGRYTVADLPEGTYLVTVDMPCCFYFPYANDAVVVSANGTSEQDIQMAAFNVNVEGDDPAAVNAELASQQVIPDEPPPRMPDGRPDLTGTWLLNQDPYPEPVPALDFAQQAFNELAAGGFLDDPSANCLPGSPPIPAGSGFITGFVQRPELLVMLLEGEPGFRQVFLDGRERPEKINPTWMGLSIGHWEGDTLVVETTGFNDRGLVQNYPRTTALKTIERFSRPTYGELEVSITYEDPNVFTAPWSQNMTWTLAPQLDIMEYVCENNQWIDTTAEDVRQAEEARRGNQ